MLWLGRDDLTRPWVVFGGLWFGAAALVQLRLTEIEAPWTTGFTALVFGGGLAFVVAAFLAGGMSPARGRVELRREEYRFGRVVGVAVVLACAGVAGAIYKAHYLDGVPLFSDNPDAIRLRGNGRDPLPSWSTALTDGFFLGLWCTLLALWIRPRGPRRWPIALALWLLAAGCVFGAALEASRNILLFTLAVPLIAAYVVTRRGGTRRRAARVIAAGVLVVVVVGGVFALRIDLASSEGTSFLDRERDRQPPAVRPFVPLYINIAFPLEADSRLYHAVPHDSPYALGGYSFPSLPSALFPSGKPPYGDTVASSMPDRGPPLQWTVATYQGRLYGDAGAAAVILGSLLLGLAFGSLYRWARSRHGLLSLGVIAYVAYYSAYMLYDNLLSFTVIAAYDLALIAAVEVYTRGEVTARLRALARTLGRESALGARSSPAP